MSSAWHKLPFEVLTYIFQHNIGSSQYTQSRKDLYTYQLVCKGWSKAAQSLLYKHISCQDSDIEDELQRFVQFIFTVKVLAPQVGYFVRTITVCDHLDRLEAPLTSLDAIFNTCPKLEDFYCNGSSKEVAWPYLLTLPDIKLSKIRSFTRQEDHFEYPNLYPFIAFKLKTSLSTLQQLRVERVSTWQSKYLHDHLPQFVSLQELTLDKCECNSGSNICQVIDRCSPTVSKLVLSNYTPIVSLGPSISVEAKAIKPNYTVHSLTINNGYIDSVSYFALKLRKLKKLTMAQVNPLPMTHRWIHGLTDLCVLLTEYNLSFNAVLEGIIKDHCIDLTRRSSPKNTFLIIDYNVRDEQDQYAMEDPLLNPAWKITLKKNGSYSGIEVRLPGSDGADVDDEFDYHTHWFDDYSPNHITIKHIEEINFMNLMTESDYFAMATTPAEFAVGFRDVHQHELTEARSWTILTRSLFSTADTTDAVVSFSEMIIPNLNGRIKHLEESSSPNVKRLTFTNSILYHQVLPIVSKWLPKLDTLIFDTCFILMEKPYTLRINLQETKLRRLGIVAGSLPFVNGLPHAAAVGRNQLRNIDLVSALSPGNQYTLRIETNGRTYLSHVKNNTRSPINNQDQEDCYGTSDNFLIWIQCSELQELSIVDGTDSDKAKHQFEPLD